MARGHDPHANKRHLGPVREAALIFLSLRRRNAPSALVLDRRESEMPYRSNSDLPMPVQARISRRTPRISIARPSIMLSRRMPVIRGRRRRRTVSPGPR
jgi:hypothetical protein